MTPEKTAAAARSAHERAAKAVYAADAMRGDRDTYIRILNTEHGWSYGKIANSVGVSKGLVAIICRTTPRPAPAVAGD